MSYPKTLSKEELEKMYLDANIDEKKSEFLHDFYLASVNLYGTVVLREMWEILKEVAPKCGMKDVKRKDLIAFSSIVRVEDVPYYVYEADELFAKEKRSDLSRVIVHKSIVDDETLNMDVYNELLRVQGSKPFYMPEDFLSYANTEMTKEEKELLSFLKESTSTAKSLRKANKNHNLLRTKQVRLFKWAEELFDEYKFISSVSYTTPSDDINKIVEKLKSAGIDLAQKQINKLVELMMEFNNNSHKWCNRGWTPTELREYYHLQKNK